MYPHHHQLFQANINILVQYVGAHSYMGYKYSHFTSGNARHTSTTYRVYSDRWMKKTWCWVDQGKTNDPRLRNLSVFQKHTGNVYPITQYGKM